MIPFLLLLLPKIYAEPLSLQTDQAVAIHVSRQGLDQIGTALKKLMPPSIMITGGSSSLSCSSDTNLEYTVSDVEIFLDIDDVAFVPSADSLRLDIYGGFYSNAVSIDLNGDCSVLTELEETCALAIPTTSFQLGVNVDLSFDGTELEAQSSEVSLSIAPIANPLSDCLLSDVVETILGQQPTLINDLILEELQQEVEDFPQDIEDSLSAITDDLFFDSSVDVLGTNVEVELFPSTIQVDEYGVWIGLGGRVHTEIPSSSCADTQSYLPSEESLWPSFTGQALASSLMYDAGLFTSRSFANNILYSMWATGGLCIDVAELSGLTLNGELAGNFFSPEVSDFIQDNPVDLQLNMLAPPEIRISDDQPPFSVDISQGALSLASIVDHRKSRILEVDLSAQIGAYVELEDNKLVFDLPLSTDDFILEESYSEFIPNGYSDGVPNLLELALSNFSYDTPSYILPTRLKLNWGALVWEPSTDQEWQAGYVFFDTQEVTPVQVPSCGVSDFGCGGGPLVSYVAMCKVPSPRQGFSKRHVLAFDRWAL